jgi:hypothetical protein
LPFLSGRVAAAGTEAAAGFVLGLDRAEAGMVVNVGPDAALINRPKYSVTENAHWLGPLATVDFVCYAGASGV